ncbi:MAG: heavy metal translocating P-type ATPase [Bacilli bacterium]|nr:heavy metal translocating P-type ATPase [Bacilli bacterium]
MQALIFKRKNLVTLLSAILIVVAFISDLIFHNDFLSQRFLIAASIVGVIPIALQAYQALRIKVVSIDFLVTIAVIGAFVLKNYEESAIVTFLFLFGAFLEQRTLNKTRKAIKELTEMAPQSALKLMDHEEYVEVAVEEVNVGDILLVKTGAKVPVDGRVLSGDGYINEASITGEATPVHKSMGSYAYAGTILENGTLQIEAEKVGEDTTFGKIIELVEEAQDSKSVAEKFIDKFAKLYTPIVLVFALIIGLILWDISIGITILVLGCPGALVIGVPVSNVAGIGNGARHGILFKGSEVISDLSKVETIVFDKTGTLTIGHPKVADTKFYTSESEEVLSYLSSIEKESDHPLAKAIVEYIGEVKAYPVDNTTVVKGGGIIAYINDKKIVIGNTKLMEQEKMFISPTIQEDLRSFENKGNSIVMVALDNEIKISIGLRDQIRVNIQDDLNELKRLGIKRLILLSGDHQETVNLVSSTLGLTEAHGNMLPEDKSHYIVDLKDHGQIVAFVGDGVNDSPSLALANIGIAMGGGTDVAIETSDVVLMNSNLNHLPHAIGLSKAIVKNMRQNIFIALAIVLGLLITIFLNRFFHFSERMMSIGMLVHEASILLVILNGMRLLNYKMKTKKKIRKE